jgi:hypothetical protein
LHILLYELNIADIERSSLLPGVVEHAR